MGTGGGPLPLTSPANHQRHPSLKGSSRPSVNGHGIQVHGYVSNFIFNACHPCRVEYHGETHVIKLQGNRNNNGTNKIGYCQKPLSRVFAVNFIKPRDCNSHSDKKCQNFTGNHISLQAQFIDSSCRSLYHTGHKLFNFCERG